MPDPLAADVEPPNTSTIMRCCDDQFNPPWLPASLWWISPGEIGRSVWSRRQSAIFRQDSTNATSYTVEAGQPTTARE
jgi:hypothetical protein